MLQIIFVCALFSSIITALHFIFYLTDQMRLENKIARLMVELKKTRSELSEERAKRIKAEGDAAYYHDHYIPELDPNTPDFLNF